MTEPAPLIDVMVEDQAWDSSAEAAVRLAMERLLLPELGHLVQQATK